MQLDSCSQQWSAVLHSSSFKVRVEIRFVTVFTGSDGWSVAGGIGSNPLQGSSGPDVWLAGGTPLPEPTVEL